MLIRAFPRGHLLVGQYPGLVQHVAGLVGNGAVLVGQLHQLRAGFVENGLGLGIGHARAGLILGIDLGDLPVALHGMLGMQELRCLLQSKAGLPDLLDQRIECLLAEVLSARSHAAMIPFLCLVDAGPLRQVYALLFQPVLDHPEAVELVLVQSLLFLEASLRRRRIGGVAGFLLAAEADVGGIGGELASVAGGGFDLLRAEGNVAY